MTGVFLKSGLPGWSGLEAGFHRLESGHETILHRHHFSIGFTAGSTPLPPETAG